MTHHTGSAAWQGSEGFTKEFPGSSRAQGRRRALGLGDRNGRGGRRGLSWAEPTRLQGGLAAVRLFESGVLRATV